MGFIQSPEELYHILYHLGENRAEYYGAVNPPVYVTSNFCAPDIASLRQKIIHEFEAPFYTRGYQPSTALLRKKLAALEGTEDALVVSSGSTAMAIAILSQVKTGDHVIIPRKPYSWTAYLVKNWLQRFGITYAEAEPGTADSYQALTQPNTRVYVLETPNSMTFEITPLRETCEAARRNGIVTIADNSYCTPLYQQPHALGVDLVCHSATKYLSGHSDVVAGVICGGAELIGKIFRSEFMVLGGILSPHDASALLKGLRTLPVRMEKVSASAMQLALFLQEHPKVKKVHYPFLPSFPGYDIARQQMAGCSGLLSVELDAGSFDGINRFTDALRCFLLATSWGGFESLAFPARVFADSQETYAMAVPWNLVRFSTGLEDADVLQSDLEKALSLL